MLARRSEICEAEQIGPSTAKLLATPRQVGSVDVDEFESFYERYAPRIAAYAARRLASVHDAQDVVGETFLLAWQRREELRGDPLPWLYGVARRLIANRVRGFERRPLHLTEDVAAPTRPQGSAGELMAAIAALPAREREALLLTVWDGLDQRAAAGVLGCSRVAVALRLRRARGHLRAALADRPIEPREVTTR
jgi:RNA polymerase sigma-70 factor (ECF subfamily)